MAPVFLRLPEVKAMTGLSTSSIYLRIAQGTFPRQIQLGEEGRAVGWLLDDLHEWMAARIAASRDC
ncbi:AlpA family transcriptional regulator [Aestuariicella hydrocarbonica]|uniref:AlpA family transcriptional regulator n=1 Tax=Pseudomaricurvus hydrocarbonicus TaxID=1470433 RepID=A0A9E5MLE7_9GAMM|nr:AlpA family transcriptional regulator [Aestuariicella hydrocarbonica]NHO66907.1 AlpA family transcriptional regulator [Aestuariicella hydrocarbonica]